MNQRTIFAAALGFFLAGAAPVRAGSPTSGQTVFKRAEIAASRAEVWKAWTTEEGAKTFFAPEVNIDATVGGHYEIFFSPDQPYGFRGAEGCKVHDLIAGELLVFNWNAPREFGVLRNLHTLVFVRLDEAGPGRTRVSLHQIGFGETPRWLKLRDYFDKGWEVVLSRLKYRFEHGPVDWDDPPPVDHAGSKEEPSGDGLALRSPGHGGTGTPGEAAKKSTQR